jgi:hypothetical protein
MVIGAIILWESPTWLLALELGALYFCGVVNGVALAARELKSGGRKP